MKKHMNELRINCTNTEFFPEGQFQSFPDLPGSTTEHTERFPPSKEDFSKNEKFQKITKNEENQR